MQKKRRFLFGALIILLLMACNLPVLQDGFPFFGSAEESVEAEGVSVTPTMPPHLTRQPLPDGPDAPTALNVALQVRNDLDVVRITEPLTSGVPLPAELGITDAGSLQLLTQDGSSVPAQFTVLARWGGTANDSTAPIKWVLLDFLADVPPKDTAYYYLQQGGPGVSPSVPLQVNDAEGFIAVGGGDVSWEFNKQDGSVFAPDLKESIHISALDSNGLRYTGIGDVDVSLAAQGPLRTAVHVKGKLRSEEQSDLLDYTARYWLYAGKQVARLFLTIENNSLCPLVDYGQLDCHDIGSGGSVEFSDLSIVIPADLGDSLSYTVVGAGESLAGELSDDLLLYQDSSGTDYWDYYPNKVDWEGHRLDTNPRLQSYVGFKGYKITLGDDILESGGQALGRVGLQSDNGVWGIGVHDFWQNFPKALRAGTQGVLEIGLFPKEFGGSDNNFTLRAGEHKTHEVWLSYAQDPQIPETTLFAEAAPEWYVNSGAFGMTALQDWSSWREHEQYITDQMITSSAKSGAWEEMYDNIPHALMASDYYGIFDYGDWPLDYEGYEIAPLNPKYDWDYGAWLQWARGGDPRWFEIAQAADRHIADIDILHNLHEPRHWGDGIAFGHSYHDEDGILNPHRNYGGSHPDTAYGMYGMLLTYYLTGYEKAYDTALELADSIQFRVSNDSNLCHLFPEGRCNGEGYGMAEGMYDAGCRPAANNLAVLVQAYRATADPHYLLAADAIVRWAKPEEQPYIFGPTGEDNLMRPWMLNMYLKSLANYIDMKAEFADSDTYDAVNDYLAYADWLRSYALIELQPIDSGARAAYPYEWFLDDRQGDPEDEYSFGNNVPSINNWLYLGADVMAYAYLLSGDQDYLDKAAILFRTGSHDPWFEGDESMYSETKQTVNAISYGHIFLKVWADEN